MKGDWYDVIAANAKISELEAENARLQGEVERLTGEVRSISFLYQQVTKQRQERAERAEQDRDRLRAALKKLCDVDGGTIGGWEASKAVEEARAVLDSNA